MGSIAKLSRNSFPDGFVFGSSSSAYQFEGETNRRGKGPNIWDTFIEEHPERISDHSNANVAVDFYNRYKEDVQRMRGMGMDAFRFSISWSRVLPHGRLSAGINEEGIQFYNNLIDELIKNSYDLLLFFNDCVSYYDPFKSRTRHDIQPYVTLFHWDTPQAIEDKYGGFLSSNILNDFRDFVELCFQKFGDRVKHWITLNEPYMFSVNGYDTGTIAPGRLSTLENYPSQPKISGVTEVYIVTHHLLLAHATAVKVYKEKYQTCQGGKIGITLVSYWFEPYSTSESDRMATKRSLDFMLGWYMDPLTKGDYPQNMHDYVVGRLPRFSEEESKMLRGSYDFIGVNYYTTYYAQNVEDVNYKNIGFMEDARVNWPGERNGIPIGPQAGSSWLYIYPEGIRHLLNYIKDAYENPTIYITENGVDDVNSSSSSLEEALNDAIREQYYKDIFHNVLRSIKISTLENYPGQPKISGATEVYIVTHHLLLAHATAVKVYKEKYQTFQGGKIGITLVSHWFEPYSTSESDRMATERSLDFMLGWYMDPLTKGDYPQNMHDYVGGRLPRFSEEESKMLRGSYDFIGVNYYTTYYAQNVEDVDYKNIGFMEDARVNWPGERNGIPIGPQAGSSWLYIYPEGIRHLLNYIKDAYENPTIYITENGVDDVNSSSLEEALNDAIREQYYKDIFHNVLKSINDHGVDVKGFFAWSFLDDFEWGSGYGSRFGLFYIDYENNLKRYAKNSVKWFKQFLKKDESTQLNDNIKSKSRMEEASARSRKKSRID